MPAGAWVTTQFFDSLGRLRRNTAVSVVIAGTNNLAAITNRDGTAATNPTNPGTKLVLAIGKAGGIDSNGNFQCWAPVGDYDVMAGSAYLGSLTVYGGAGGGGLALSAATPTPTTVGGHAVGTDGAAAHGLHAHDLGAHAASHDTVGSDPISIAESQVRNLSTDLTTLTTSLSTKANDAAVEHIANKAVANGYCDLDVGGQVPLARLGHAPGGGGAAATYASRIAKRMTFA